MESESWSSTAAGPLLASHPHSVFAKVSSLGYSLEYGRREDSINADTNLRVRVLKEGQIVADAGFYEDTVRLYPQNTDVLPDHKRCKLATAMYLLAELVSGKSLINSWKDEGQSEEAKALWDNPNRPFGNNPPWFVSLSAESQFTPPQTSPSPPSGTPSPSPCP